MNGLRLMISLADVHVALHRGLAHFAGSGIGNVSRGAWFGRLTSK